MRLAAEAKVIASHKALLRDQEFILVPLLPCLFTSSALEVNL